MNTIFQAVPPQNPTSRTSAIAGPLPPCLPQPKQPPRRQPPPCRNGHPSAALCRPLHRTCILLPPLSPITHAPGSRRPAAAATPQLPYVAPYTSSVPAALTCVRRAISDCAAYLRGLYQPWELLPALFAARDKVGGGYGAKGAGAAGWGGGQGEGDRRGACMRGRGCISRGSCCLSCSLPGTRWGVGRERVGGWEAANGQQGN